MLFHEPNQLLIIKKQGMDINEDRMYVSRIYFTHQFIL